MTKELHEIFPPSDGRHPPAFVLDETVQAEEVLWHGKPDRRGFFRATPFAVAVVTAVVASVFMSADTGPIPWQYATSLVGATGEAEASMMIGLVLAFVALLALGLHDRRQRWTYVVTDRRLMTFHRGRKLREARPWHLDRLRVVPGVEGRVRDTGDVIWARITDNPRGPDRGRHGFRGMRDPEEWKRRLMQWREAVERRATEDARGFSGRFAEPAAAGAPASGSRAIENRRYGFSMTIPERWVGRIGLRQPAPLRLFGLELPIGRVREVSNEPLHAAPDDWNYIAVTGRSGMKFGVDISDGPPVAAFETSRDRIGDALVDADGDYRCGPLYGYRIDYVHLERQHNRFAMLAGDGFHVLFNVVLPLHQARELLPAIDAVFASIRES